MIRSLEILGELHALATSAKTGHFARHQLYGRADDLAALVKLDVALNLIAQTVSRLEKKPANDLSYSL